MGVEAAPETVAEAVLVGTAVAVEAAETVAEVGLGTAVAEEAAETAEVGLGIAEAGLGTAEAGLGTVEAALGTVAGLLGTAGLVEEVVVDTVVD